MSQKLSSPKKQITKDMNTSQKYNRQDQARFSPPVNNHDPKLESRLVAPDSPIAARLVAPECLPRVKREQYKVLEGSFTQCRNPHYIDIMLIAAQTGLSEETVTIWFEHRLALWRKQQGLPANSGHVIH